MTQPAFESEVLKSELPEAVFLEDLDGNILDVNDQACELLGYEREELLELTVDDLVPEGEPAFLPGQIDEATRSGEPLETVNIRKDGTKVPMELRGRIIEIEGKERILVTVRDISDRKRAERKLKQSQKRLKWALEGTKAGIWDWNVQTGDVVFSERWAEIGGYTLEELQPVTFETWEELAHPEDLKRSEELMEKHFNGETEVYECEVRMKHKNGGWVWILDRGGVVEWNEEGEPTRMVGTHQDITDRKKAEQALNEQPNKLKNLHKAVYELQRQDDEEEILQTAVDVAEEMLDFELCAVAILEGEKLVPKANSTELDPDQTATFKVGEGITGKTLKQGETIWGEDLRNYRGAQPTQDDFRAFISVPIGNIGTMQVISKEVSSFDKRDVELTEILTGHLEQELKRVRLEEQLREKADSIKSTSDKLESLHNVARRLESVKDVQEVFQLGVEAAVDTLEFLVCSFSVARGDHFEVMATSEESPKEWTHEDMPIDEGLTGKTYRTKETYVFGDLREVEEAKPARPEYRSIISLPIGDIGVFQVLSEQVEAFSVEDARLAELLCGHVYEATQRVRLENELKKEAIHDPLTGLYNRRYLNERLSEERERAERYDKPIAFLMMDINSFKEINDRYTHQRGDKVLQELANLLRENVRSADTVVRYGGDEFLVVMPETNGGVSEVVNRLEEELLQWNEQTCLIDFPLTLAMGISHWSPEQDRDVEEALKEADEKMYEDKGR